MLSKEEIEKAKDDLIFFNEGDYITREMDRSADVLEEYIEQLEQENKKQNKIINEMVEFIVSSVIVEDTVCSRIFCNKEGDCSYKKQKKCTKQYFEKKVEEK